MNHRALTLDSNIGGRMAEPASGRYPEVLEPAIGAVYAHCAPFRR